MPVHGSTFSFLRCDKSQGWNIVTVLLGSSAKVSRAYQVTHSGYLTKSKCSSSHATNSLELLLKHD